ncbi:MAG: ABC transporter substrate-binding protein [Winkia neuii]|uniref:ABC transporter substrate-binding protein n=1 Tax=Winkia neuii TaxID=33007 RepID=A0A2I1ILH6_9ACTO|nr:ABC transporter substrate-binding protein [Winkia neuii]OFJ70593.1 ABC transporter substrate-binding protein [Actinomyces sp. HMSC064C12]OFK02687.1 ABC transporter substrate-binding protein [Actinomyces sp. HMSC072A03]OFT54130.1 ABC transporter substrate-binding protein [Actinomyces sp. HMSC06A08]MDK8099405.1 ABC transporter substrate-binding protein [Winkia neuii]MDU3134516.1 ABC transporter substrate-binding protein [Winkia neuii]
MRPRKITASLLTLALLPMLAGCAQEANDSQAKPPASASQSQQPSKEISFTDQADHQVKVKVPVKRMVVLQHHSVDILAQLGAQKQVVGIEKKWERNLGEYMKDVFPGIQKLATPGQLDSMNVENVAALKPDIVIVASQANPADLKKLESLHIPYATVSLRAEGKQKEAQNPRLANSDKAYTDGLEWSVKTLGKLTGKQERANKLWEFTTQSRKYVESKVGKVTAPKTVLVANEGGQTYGNDKYVGAQLVRAGAVNVAAKDIQGYKQYNFEQALAWDPDYVVVQDRYPEVYEQVTTDPKWQKMRAVKNGNVIKAPYWTKPWGNPDTDSMALGEPYFAHKFYPDLVSASYVQKRAEAFYKTFYGVPFKGKVSE